MRRIRENSPSGVFGRDDAVAASLAARNLLHADHAAAGLQVAVAHLRQHRLPRRRSGRPPGARKTVRCRPPHARTAPRGRGRAVRAGGCRCRWRRQAGCRAAGPQGPSCPVLRAPPRAPGSESKWSSMARLELPVMNTSRRAPAASASSAAYWISGLSTIGSISFGLALVAGRKRVPRPATGKTAKRIGAGRLTGFPSVPGS